MSYVLVALFLATGKAYVEEKNLSLNECSLKAALAKQAVTPEIVDKIGPVLFFCAPSKS